MKQTIPPSSVRQPLALAKVATYAGRVVKQPFINGEEKIDRFVNRRT
jgi:hypothetical protein